MPNPETANSVENFRRNVANWYPVIRQAYCWLPETDLRSGSGKGTRYTPFCCEQMEALMSSTNQGRSYDDWLTGVHHAHADDYEAYQKLQAAEPKQPSQPLDAEIVEPQSTDQLVTLNQSSSYQVGSLINVNVGALNITVQAANTSPIDTQTAQYRDLTNQAASVLNQGLTVATEAKYNEAVAQIDNAIAGMQANALLNIVQKQADQQPAPGKSPAPSDPTISG